MSPIAEKNALHGGKNRQGDGDPSVNHWKKAAFEAVFMHRGDIEKGG